MSTARTPPWRRLGYAAALLLSLTPALLAEPAGADGAMPPCEACHRPSVTPPTPEGQEETCFFFCKTKYFNKPEGMHASFPCTACHPSAQVGVFPHQTPVTPVDCAASCHQAQAKVVETTAHSSAALRGAGLKHLMVGEGQSTCLSCHPPHAGQGYGEEVFSEVNRRSRPCLACHSEQRSGAPQVHGYEHPLHVFENGGPRWLALNTLPLFDTHGVKVPEGDNGALTCNSCHSNHGRDTNPEHLRRPGWQKACAACHGPDSLVLYRYFHWPERRADINVREFLPEQLTPACCEPPAPASEEATPAPEGAGPDGSAPGAEAAPERPADGEAGH
ncbi:MAG: hypothetical protein ABIO70_04960 [Pseudomonadota bacterium]